MSQLRSMEEDPVMLTFARLVAILDILKSPMILLAIASLALIVGLPYITENSTSIATVGAEELMY